MTFLTHGTEIYEKGKGSYSDNSNDMGLKKIQGLAFSNHEQGINMETKTPGPGFYFYNDKILTTNV